MRVDIKPYVYWSMFTSAGNKSISNKAQKLIDRINVAKTDKQIKKALHMFLRSYKQMYSTKTMGESNDTAVREVVFGFYEEVIDHSGIDIDPEKMWHDEGC